MKNKFYVVKVGRVPGIYIVWTECRDKINGFPEAIYKSFNSYVDALSYLNGTTSEVTVNYVYPSISVDAACSGNPGYMEYRGVDTKTKEILFHVGPISGGTNNLGECMSLVHGVTYLKNLCKNIPIYTDSVTGQAWIKKKRMNSSVTAIKGSELEGYIKRTEEVLLTLPEWEILKWNTREWGEILQILEENKYIPTKPKGLEISSIKWSGLLDKLEVHQEIYIQSKVHIVKSFIRELDISKTLPSDGRE